MSKLNMQRYTMEADYVGATMIKDDYGEWCDAEEVKILLNQLTRAAVFAFREMNEIRARDGVPYTHMGCKSSVTEEHFSRVADMLDEAVKAATGKSAHCHPELYK